MYIHNINFILVTSSLIIRITKKDDLIVKYTHYDYIFAIGIYQPKKKRGVGKGNFKYLN